MSTSHRAGPTDVALLEHVCYLDTPDRDDPERTAEAVDADELPVTVTGTVQKFEVREESIGLLGLDGA